MNILCLQETDWLTRGPHTQHHILERLSMENKNSIVVFDYDIDKLEKSKSIFIKKKIYTSVFRTIKNSKVEIIRTCHLQIPYLRRITSLISNFFGLIKQIKIKRPDIILSFSLTNGILGLILARMYNILIYSLLILHPQLWNYESR